MTSPEARQAQIPKANEVNPLDSLVDPELYSFLVTISSSYTADGEASIQTKPLFLDVIPKLYGDKERSPQDMHNLFETMNRRIVPLIDLEIITSREGQGDRLTTLNYEDMLTVLSYLWVKAKLDRNTRRSSFAYEAMNITSGMWGDTPRGDKFAKGAAFLLDEALARQKSMDEKSNQDRANGVPMRYWWESDGDVKLSDKLKSITLDRVKDMIGTCDIMLSQSAFSTREKDIDLYMFRIDRPVLEVIKSIAAVNRIALGTEPKKGTKLEELMGSLKVIAGYLTQYPEKIRNLGDLYRAIAQVEGKS